MAGRVQWEAQVDSNVAKLLGETKELRNELESISKKDIKLDIDSKSLNSIVDLFGKMESHLKDLKKVFVDVGDGAEFSPLLKTINNIQSSIDKLSTSIKKIGFNMNIDFGSDTEMEAKIQSKISNALQAYQRLFDHIKMTGVGGSMINTNFFEFDINQYDTTMAKLQAYRKFIETMRNEAKAQFNGEDVLFQGTDKSYWTSASAAMGQVTKAFNEMNASADTSPLENLFGGKTNLTEVVSQLGLIVTKLEEISSIASKMAKVDVPTTPIKDTFQGDTKASAESSTPAVKEEAKAMEQVAESAEKASKAKNEFSDANERVNKGAKKSADSIKNESTHLDKISDMVTNYRKSLKDLSAIPDGNHRFASFESLLNDLNIAITELENHQTSLKNKDFVSEDDIVKTNTLSNEITTLIETIKKIPKSERGFSDLGVSKMAEKINSILNENPRLSRRAKEEIRAYYKELTTGNPTKPLNEIYDAVNRIIQKEREAGRAGKGFLDIFNNKLLYEGAGKLAGYFLGFTDFIRYGQEGFEIIKEYDKALTEMNKVSNETISTLKEFQQESFDLADAVGTTASQIQNSTADFLRLGESFEQAKQSAQDANALFKVSEYDSINEATDALISMSQAYKELEKSEITDILNYVGNNFSLSTSDLATAMKDAAAVLKTQGNDLYEAVALITAGNAITQDPSKTAGGVRTISLRIAGTEEAKEQLQSLGESVDDYVVQTKSKTQETIKNFTAVASNMGKGIDVLDANGNLRATYDILLDISKIYKEIQEEDKKYGTNRANALVEYIAGKNRSNIASSILLNPELLEEVKESAIANAEGSVQKELDAQLQSIETHLLQLKNAWDELWINENNREIINFFLDLAKGILEVVDDVGVLNTAIMGIGAFAGIKNVGINMLVAY